MNRLFSHALTSTTLAAVLAIGVAGQTADLNAQDRHSKATLERQPATMMLGPGFIDFDVHIDAERAILRIAGPERYGLTLRTDMASTVTADLLFDARPPNDLEEHPDAKPVWDELPDGRYSYELNLYTAAGERHVTRGQFQVSGGQPQKIAAPRNEGQSSTSEPGWLGRIAGAALDFLVPSAHAGLFEDDFLDVLDAQADNNTNVTLRNVDNPNIAMCNSDGALQLATGTACSGDVAFHLSSTGKIGINNTAPLEIFHIVDPNNNSANVRIENTANAYTLSTGENTGFRIRQVVPSTATPFRIEPNAPTDSIRVTADGNVGLGTGAPVRTLDVVSNQVVPLRIRNSGNANLRFALVNGQAGSTWTFDNLGDEFRITQVGGSAPGSAFRVLENGDGRFAGDVYAKGVQLTSARTKKTDFKALNHDHMLDKVAQLEVAEWRYKTDPETNRHIGPFAEDFQSLFGIGDGKHISAVDFAGVSLSAIKALKNELAIKDDRIKDLSTRLSALENQISDTSPK